MEGECYEYAPNGIKSVVRVGAVGGMSPAKRQRKGANEKCFCFVYGFKVLCKFHHRNQSLVASYQFPLLSDTTKTIKTMIPLRRFLGMNS